jgi:hypothetical protein
MPYTLAGVALTETISQVAQRTLGIPQPKFQHLHGDKPLGWCGALARFSKFTSEFLDFFNTQ